MARRINYCWSMPQIKTVFDAVKRVNNLPRPFDQGRPAPVYSATGFWAKIVNIGGYSVGGKYAWTREISNESPGFSDVPNPTTDNWTKGTADTNFTFEISGYTFVPDGSIVWLSLIGQKYCMFSYPNQRVRCMTTVALLTGTSVDCTVTTWGGSSLGQTISVRNESGFSVAASKTVYAERQPLTSDGLWYLYMADCSPSP